MPVAAGQIPPQTGQGEFAPQQAQSQLATYSQLEPQPQLAPEFQPVPGPEGPPEYPAPDMSHMQVQPVAAPETYAPVDAPMEAPAPEAVPQPGPELTREAVQEAPQEAAEAVAPPVAADAPAPVSEPGAHETGGRDSGSVDLGAVRIPTATSTPTPPPARRPLHMGPPMPDSTGGVVRSLADRGPTSTPPTPVRVRTQGPPTTGPEYLDIPREEAAALPGPQLGAIPVQGADPWASVPPQSDTPVAEAPEAPVA
ncbi:nicotinate-nucleotide--dimethylbenzimidazole phosphoribosyltransferase, partial [Streptomyces niveus]